jgi:hypothetical protein
MKRLLLAGVALSAFTGMKAALANVPPRSSIPLATRGPRWSPGRRPELHPTGFYAGGAIGGAAEVRNTETTSGTSQQCCRPPFE